MQSTREGGIRAIVHAGRGEAAGFTRIDWVRAHALAAHGIDPFPGTLNLVPADDASRAAWRALRAAPSSVLVPPDAGFCNADWHAVSVDGLPAVAVVPAVAGYPHDSIEIVAALGLRDALGLADGDTVSVAPAVPLAPRVALFDVDGTLVDSLAAYVAIAQAAGAPDGVAIEAAAVHRALAYGEPFWNGVIAPDHPERAALMERLMTRARALWPATMREHCRPIDRIGAALGALERRGVRLGIVTGARPEVVELLGALGLERGFEVVVGATDVKRRKPDPEGLLLALSRLGADAAEAIYVGDSPIDIVAAHRAGMRAVGVLTGAGDGAMLTRAGADRLAPSVAELPALLQP